MKIKKFQSLYLAHLFIPKIKTLVRLLQMEWHMFLMLTNIPNSFHHAITTARHLPNQSSSIKKNLSWHFMF